MRVAEDAAQRNVELESEIRGRNQELEMLKEVNRERCREVKELKSSNDELCSIIRHALEDMKREKMNFTNALHDRIERHAPSALGSCFADMEYYVQRPKDVPYVVDSVFHAPVGNGSNAMSSNVPAVAHRDCSQTGTPSHLGPASKRRREETPALDERWDQPNSRICLPASEYPRPNHRGDVAASAIPATSALASGTTSDQEIVAPGLIGFPFYLSGSMASQQDDQQSLIESSINNPFPRGDARSNSPVQLDSFPNHNITNPPLPEPEQGQLLWMPFDQSMMDSNFFGTIPESPTLGRPF